MDVSIEEMRAVWSSIAEVVTVALKSCMWQLEDLQEGCIGS